MPDTEIRSVMVPLTGVELVMPQATIAEVVSYTEPDSVSDAAEWLLGTVLWRGWQVPVISFARLIDDSVQESTSGARLCITKTLIDSERMPYVGVLSQGHPRLITVTDANFEEVPTDTNPIAVAGRVRIEDREAVLPDLDRLGHLVAHAAFGALPLTS